MGKKHSHHRRPDPSASQLLAQAQQHHRSGRFAEAEREYRAVLRSEPDNSEATQLLGVVLFQTGRVQQAVELMRRATEIDPANVQAVTNLATAYVELGDHYHALGAFERAIQLAPAEPDAYVGRAHVLNGEGRHAEALNSARMATSIHPKHPGALFQAGRAYQELGQAQQAVDAYTSSLALDPRNPDALNNLGSLQIQLGRPRDAVGVLQRALTLDPKNMVALVNLASAHIQLGELDQARALSERALIKDPRFGAARQILAKAQQESGDLPTALASYAQLRGISGWDEEASAGAARLLLELGEVTEAVETLSLTESSVRIGALKALALPTILRDREEIAEARDRLTTGLERALATGGRLQAPETEIGQTAFFLAYHGLTERAEQEAIARFYEQAAPVTAWHAPHAQEPKPVHGRKVKVGVVSALLHRHTIGKLFGNLVKRLPGEDVEVVFFKAPGTDDDVSASIESAVDKTVRLGAKLPIAHRQIADEEPDVLFYPEVGMDAFTYYLAFARLAPVQCATWGHPMTTGSPNMDYFLSSSRMETASSDALWTERLVRMSELQMVFDRPTVPPDEIDRASFGLPGDAVIYACPQTLFKLHPDFDDAVAELLKRDPKGLFVLIEGKHPSWTDRYRERIRRTHPHLAERTVFLPKMGLDRFLGLLKVADVVLDPFHFGGGNSTLEALAVGVPVVTLPGEQLRNRITLAMYEKIGLTGTIATDPDHYVELALQMANDADFRHHASKHAAEASEPLFDASAPVEQMRTFCRRAATAAAEGRRLSGAELLIK